MVRNDTLERNLDLAHDQFVAEGTPSCGICTHYKGKSYTIGDKKKYKAECVHFKTITDMVPGIRMGVGAKWQKNASYCQHFDSCIDSNEVSLSTMQKKSD